MSRDVLGMCFVGYSLILFAYGYWAGDRAATKDTERRWSEAVARKHDSELR